MLIFVEAPFSSNIGFEYSKFMQAYLTTLLLRYSYKYQYIRHIASIILHITSCFFIKHGCKYFMFTLRSSICLWSSYLA